MKRFADRGHAGIRAPASSDPWIGYRDQTELS
jgi:hypothetical protein